MRYEMAESQLGVSGPRPILRLSNQFVAAFDSQFSIDDHCLLLDERFAKSNGIGNLRVGLVLTYQCQDLLLAHGELLLILSWIAESSTEVAIGLIDLEEAEH